MSDHKGEFMTGSKLVRVTILAALAKGLLSSGFSVVNQAKEGSKPILITDDCELIQDVMLQPQPDGPANRFVESGEEEEGPTAGDAILPVGQTVKFQCCIHPWMRTELRVK